jgi:hypothetical protein
MTLKLLWWMQVTNFICITLQMTSKLLWWKQIIDFIYMTFHMSSKLLWWKEITNFYSPCTFSNNNPSEGEQEHHKQV